MATGVIDYGRKWQIMATVGISIFLTLLDTYIVNVALPTLTRVFETDFATVQWVVLAYLLTLTTLMLTFGRLGDMLGKKPVYLVGLLIFTTGSVLCGLAPTVGWLIVFRVVQALGGAILFALGMAIITEAFPSHERGKAMGAAGAIIALGVVAGPVFGGILIEALSWQWIFFINVPIGVVGLITAVQFIPAIQPKGNQ
ncbi:MAG: MFS transporter, partial [Anaerolineales bacterium]|nr:MFS transporter [Anaerolineales bacterium]